MEKDGSPLDTGRGGLLPYRMMISDQTYILSRVPEPDCREMVLFTPDTSRNTVVLRYWQTGRISPHDSLHLHGMHPEDDSSCEVDIRLATGMPLTVCITIGRAVWVSLVGQEWTEIRRARPNRPNRPNYPFA